MNGAVQIEVAQVIAAMTPPISKAGFNLAQLVVQSPDGALVQARAYTSDHQAVGPRLTEDELRGLIEAGHAIAVAPPCKLVSGAAIWVLRRGLPHRDRALQELRTAGVLVYPPMPGPDDAWLCLVDESVTAALSLRDRWRDDAMLRAKHWAGQRDWTRAEAEAEHAHQFARGLEPEVLAMLSLAHEKCDRVKRAQGLLTMARNSRGPEFASDVDAALKRLRLELDAENTEQNTARSALRELLAARFSRCPNVTRHLGEPRTARLDADAA